MAVTTRASRFAITLAIAHGLSAGAAYAQEDSSGGGTDIVVTAQRREERLLNVPLSVAAFSQDALTKSRIDDARQLQLVTPGLTFTQGAFAPAPTLRGVGTRGSQIGDESVVPQYIDGVYQSFLFGQMADFNNLQRIEVLRGPQSALYGRNAVGGAINIVTKNPSVDPSAELTVGYGRFNDRRADGYVTGGAGTLAADLAIHYRQDDGYLRDVNLNRDAGATNTLGLRSKIMLTPSDRFTLTVALAYSRTYDGVSTGNKPLDGNTVARRTFPNVLIPAGRYDIAQTAPTEIFIKQGSASAKMEYHGERVDITSITAYSRARLSGQNDSDSTPAPILLPTFTYTDRSFLQEVYANVQATDRLRGIVGAVYYTDTAENAPSQAGSVNSLGQSTLTSVNSRVRTHSYAVYGQLEYEIVPHLTAIVAGRYTSETKNFLTSSLTTNFTTGQITTIAPPLAQKTWKRFTPSGTLHFQASPTMQIYARAAQGFKSGIFNTAGVNTTPVNPETAWQYEVGLKAALSPAISLSVAAYHTRQSDVQITARDPITGASLLQNAASTHNTGGELDLFVRPAAGLNLRVGVSYMDAKFQSFPNATVTIPLTAVAPPAATPCILGTGALLGGNRSVICDVSGNPVPRTPRFTMSFSPDYTFAVGQGSVTISANAYYETKFYFDPLKRLVQPAYFMARARASWQINNNLHLAAWSENITNAHPLASLATSTTADNAIVSKPRTFGVDVGLKF